MLQRLLIELFQIDLDTIDVSNLNRQFLFHKEHVGKSKAEVARESALAFNPNVKIKAYHDSITTYVLIYHIDITVLFDIKLLEFTVFLFIDVGPVMALVFSKDSKLS